MKWKIVKIVKIVKIKWVGTVCGDDFWRVNNNFRNLRGTKKLATFLFTIEFVVCILNQTCNFVIKIQKRPCTHHGHKFASYILGYGN